MRLLYPAIKLSQALSGEPNLDSLAIKPEFNLQPKNQIVLPISVKNETTAKSDLNFSEQSPYSPKSRTTIKAGKVEIKYDWNNSPNPSLNPDDTFKAGISEPFGIKKFSAAYLNLGNWNKNDVKGINLSKGFKLGKNLECLFDLGHLVQKGAKPLQWSYLDMSIKDLYGMVSAFYQTDFAKGKTDFFGMLGADVADKLSVTIGASKGPRYNSANLVLNTHDMKDFGTCGIFLYNPKTKGVTFKTRTALGDVSQGFYKRGFSNFVNSLFTFPPFFFPHFSPFMTKGKNSISLDGKFSKEGLENFEAMVGRQTKAGMIGAGFYFQGNSKTPSVMYYAPYSFKGMDGSIELYANKEKGLSAYLTTDLKNNVTKIK